VIRKLLAAAIGGLVTFLFLVIWGATNFTEPLQAYALAGLIGGLGYLVWPALVGFFLVRRAKSRRDEIQKEVDKQVAAQQK
jgi:hypothetical protein